MCGYRNKAAELLLRDLIPKVGQCSVLLTCFPKIIDNPDLNETLAQVWYEDVYKKQGATDVESAVK